MAALGLFETKDSSPNISPSFTTLIAMKNLPPGPILYSFPSLKKSAGTSWSIVDDDSGTVTRVFFRSELSVLRYVYSFSLPGDAMITDPADLVADGIVSSLLFLLMTVPACLRSCLLVLAD